MKLNLLTLFKCLLLLEVFLIPAMQNTSSIPVKRNTMLSPVVACGSKEG